MSMCLAGKLSDMQGPALGKETGMHTEPRSGSHRCKQIPVTLGTSPMFWISSSSTKTTRDLLKTTNTQI